MPTTGSAPKPNFATFPCSGVLNEWETPAKLGGSGLTDCANLIYHRNDSWGKRPGNTEINLQIGGTPSDVAGVRWYRAFPDPLTKLVLYTNSHIYVGNDAAALTNKGHFAQSGTTPPMFASARDPQARNGLGADVLIVTGVTQANGSFGTGNIVVSGVVGSAPTGTKVSITVSDGVNPVTTSQYIVLGSDNVDSIAQQLAQLLNESMAFLSGFSNGPYLGTTYFTSDNDNQTSPQADGSATPQATIFLGARHGGGAGNSITYKVNYTPGTGGGTLAFTATGTTNFTGGGNDWSGPLRYDPGIDIWEGLSYMAPNPFTSCVSWHSHTWFWGDPNNPDTVFASDINQPESFTFMIENGGMDGPDNGGYTIGPGDGDPVVWNCVPNGNSLYIFKTANIYMIEGYDFQQGEYIFSVTPQIIGYGIPSRDCVTVLEGQFIAWTGRKMIRFQVGAYEPEHIGFPIPISEGLASVGNQMIIRAVAGDFQVQSQMINRYMASSLPDTTTILMRSVALFAVDFGNGKPTQILMYDDEKTGMTGQYAWTKWSGFNVGCWILYGQGQNPAGTDADKPQLWFLDPSGEDLHLVGGNAFSDAGVSIPWMAQTGWVSAESPEVLKNMERMFINVESTPGPVIKGTMIPGQIINPATNYPYPYNEAPQPITFQPMAAPANAEAVNDAWQYTNNGQTAGTLPIQSKSLMMQFTEDGTADAAFEMLTWGLDVIAEAFQ